MDGFLNINKPKGFTSHDVVDLIRKTFRLSKVGHLGTLDPLAKGVLPIAIGRSTRLAELLINTDKEYAGTFFLGVETDTQDIEGKIISKGKIHPLTLKQLEMITSEFCGEQKQLIPMYSARRHKGKRLFELARKGRVPAERPVKVVNIHKFKISSIEPPRLNFFIHCSKGTYIRTVASDFGKEIGCGACLLNLVRLRKGPFVFSESLSLSDLNGKIPLEKSIIPEQRILSKIS